MTRWFVISFAIAIFCIIAIQAAPMQEATNANKVDDVFNKAVESFSQGLDTVMKNPQVDSFLKETQKFFGRVGEKLKKDIEIMIPSTEGDAKNQ